MPTTLLGYIDYVSKGDTDWYSDFDGLETWLERVELLGIPTYDTFSDLPSPGTPSSHDPSTTQTQRQFAAVVADQTIYRVNDAQDSWVAWSNYYTDSDAETAINNDSDHGSTAPHNYFSGSHTDLTNVGSSDHHAKTTSLADITDADPAEIIVDTLANQPAAGTANRWHFTSDNNGIYYDDGAAWQLIAEYPGNISASELGFDPATQSELDSHAGTAGAHHTRYSDSEARTAVEGSVNMEDLVTASTTTGHVARSQGDGTLLAERLAHGDLSGVGSGDHHSRYTDEEAQDATGTMAGNALTYDDATPSLDVDESGISHDNISGVSAGDHHTKTTSLADITDVDPSEIRTGTLSNRPAAGTAGRWYLTTDNNGIYYDDGASWFLIAEHPSNIGAGDLGFDTATQSELDSHAGTSGAHHSRYSDSEARTAVEGSVNVEDLVTASTAAGYVVRTQGDGTIQIQQLGHGDLGGVSSGDHHAKTNSLDELNDTNVTDFTADTQANRPAAGTADRVYVETDTGRILRDNGTSWDVMGVSDHSQLSGIGSGDHHTRYSDEEAQDATGAMAGNALTYDDATPALDVDEASISHDNISGVSSGDHHAKTASLDELNDTNVTDFTADTQANRPAAGTADRVYVETDNGRILYDDGTNWLMMGATLHDQLGNVTSGDHHTRYADSEARGAIEAGDVQGVQLANSEHGDYDTDGFLYWDLSAGAYIKSSNASGSQTGGSLLWSSENFTAGNYLSASYGGEDEPTLDVLDSVNPVWQNGDEVVLESMISPGFDTSTSSTSFVDLTTMPERGVLDWGKYHVLQPHVQQFDVWYGQYRVDAPLTLRVSYFGNGESGASKTDATYSSDAYRVNTRWTISDITNYGVWTPNFRAKSEDGSTVRVRGGGTLYLIAVT